jgi:hypothetical protein
MYCVLCTSLAKSLKYTKSPLYGRGDENDLRLGQEKGMRQGRWNLASFHPNFESLSTQHRRHPLLFQHLSVCPSEHLVAASTCIPGCLRSCSSKVPHVQITDVM